MNIKTHREQYPEQYNHPLVGYRVRVDTIVGIVTRVVPSRLGPLAEIDGQSDTLYYVASCIIAPETNG
jgi:hypothetical protein